MLQQFTGLLFLFNINLGYFYLGSWSLFLLGELFSLRGTKNNDIYKIKDFSPSKNQLKIHLTYSLVHEDCYVSMTPQITEKLLTLYPNLQFYLNPQFQRKIVHPVVLKNNKN